MIKTFFILFFAVVLFSMIQAVHAETIVISEDTTLGNFIVGKNDVLQIQPNVLLILEGELENFGLIENNEGTIQIENTVENSGQFINSGLIEIVDEIRNLDSGIINNTGEIVNFGNIRNSGIINNNFGGTITLNDNMDNFNEGIVHNNDGAHFKINDQLDNRATFQNHLGGLITINQGNNGLLNREVLINNGTIVNNSILKNDEIFEGEGEFDNFGTLENFGTFENLGDFSNFGTLENHGNFDNHNTMHNTGNMNNFGKITHDSGTLINVGTINNSREGIIDIFSRFINTLNESKNQHSLIINQGIFRVNTILSESFGTTKIINDGGLFEITEDGAFLSIGLFENTNGGLVRIQGFLGTGNSKEGDIFDNYSLIENFGDFNNVGTINNHKSGKIVNFIEGSIDNRLSKTRAINNFGTIENLGIILNKNENLLLNEGLYDNFGTIENDGTFLNQKDATLNNLCESSFENKGTLDNFGIITGSVVISSGGSLIIHEGGKLETECKTKTLPIPVDFSPSQKSQESNGSSAKSYLNRPTFGLSHTTHLPLVENGYTVNENSFGITDNWHTDFEKQTIIVGETNTFSAKAYAPFGLQWVEFMFGISEVGKAHESEAVVEVWLDQKGGVEKFLVEQKENLIDSKSLTAEAEMVKCTSNDTNKNCNLITISAFFNEAPLYDVFALKGVDFTRRSHITYLNEGFAVEGESLNPPKTELVASSKKGVGLMELTLVDKRNRIWIDDSGDKYKENSFGTFVKTSSTHIERDDPLSNVMTRQNSNFEKIIHYEMKRAIKVFDSSMIQGDISESFSYEFPERISKLYDPEIQARMSLENQRAELILSQMSDY